MLTVSIQKCEEGGYIAECQEIPGCMSQGETIAETEANIRNAIEECIAVVNAHFDSAYQEYLRGESVGIEVISVIP